MRRNGRRGEGEDGKALREARKERGSGARSKGCGTDERDEELGLSKGRKGVFAEDLKERGKGGGGVTGGGGRRQRREREEEDKEEEKD